MTEHAAQQDSADDLLGRVLGERYRIEARLGRGGMGTVYRAHHLSLRRDVAVKVLHPRLTQNPATAKRFEREALATSKLDHLNCVQVLDAGTAEGGLQYIVMQLLDGCELAAVLDAPMTPQRTIEVIRQILSGLDHAHRRALVHRDLKPENIFLVQDDHGKEVVKIVDFGIVKLLATDEDHSENLTRAGVMFGTPHYMSPEQVAGGKIDARTDLYAVGVLMYQMLAGRRPFDGDEVAIVLRMHMIADPPPLPESVPEPLRAIVARLLEKRAADRFATAHEVLEALDAARASMHHPPAAPLAAPGSSRPVLLEAAAVVPGHADRAQKTNRLIVAGALAIAFLITIGWTALAVRGCGSPSAPAAAQPPVSEPPGPAATTRPPEVGAGTSARPVSDTHERGEVQRANPKAATSRRKGRQKNSVREAHKRQEEQEREARKRREEQEREARKRREEKARKAAKRGRGRGEDRKGR